METESLRRRMASIFERLIAGASVADLLPEELELLEGLRVGEEQAVAAAGGHADHHDNILDAVLAAGHDRNRLNAELVAAKAELDAMPSLVDLDRRYITLERELAAKISVMIEPKRALFVQREARREVVERIAQLETDRRAIRIRNPILFQN